MFIGNTNASPSQNQPAHFAKYEKIAKPSYLPSLRIFYLQRKRIFDYPVIYL